MISLFDTNILIYLVSECVQVPLDPSTQRPLTRPRDRIDYLIKQVQERREKIIIPTPVLAEILENPSAHANMVVSALNQSPFRIVAFDQAAAAEYGVMKRQSPPKLSDQPRSGVKFDHMILAIAKVANVDVIYTDDKDLRRFAEVHDIRVVSSWELNEDPAKRQLPLPLGE